MTVKEIESRGVSWRSGFSFCLRKVEMSKCHRACKVEMTPGQSHSAAAATPVRHEGFIGAEWLPIARVSRLLLA